MPERTMPSMPSAALFSSTRSTRLHNPAPRPRAPPVAARLPVHGAEGIGLRRLGLRLVAFHAEPGTLDHNHNHNHDHDGDRDHDHDHDAVLLLDTTGSEAAAAEPNPVQQQN
ncbi:hypothetical protein [Streptomyces avermitilis]|uniref:hypothetical protein n=1 Tax=Streptomyces avermitilis TaxID=33903 RepID=UPI0033FEA445